jgi:hypothetical protein
MKLPVIAALLLCLGLAGCDSGDFQSAVNTVMNKGEPKTRTFDADPKACFVAGKKALDGIYYHYTKGGEAEGKLEAMSDVMPGETIGASRQVSLKATFTATADGKTEVSVLFTETIESDSSKAPGQATSQPLTDTPLYEMYFRNLEQALAGHPLT